MFPFIRDHKNLSCWLWHLKTFGNKYVNISSVQSLSRVQLFVTPWTAAPQASLSNTISQSLPKLMSIESVMPSNHLILCRPLLHINDKWTTSFYPLKCPWLYQLQRLLIRTVNGSVSHFRSEKMTLSKIAICILEPTLINLCQHLYISLSTLLVLQGYFVLGLKETEQRVGRMILS